MAKRNEQIVRKRTNSQISPTAWPKPTLVRETGGRKRYRQNSPSVSGKKYRVPLALIVVLLLGAAVLQFFSTWWFSAEESSLARALAVSPGAEFKPLIPEPEASEGFEISHTVASGQTLGSILERYGYSMPDAEQLLSSIKNLSKEEPSISASIRKGQELFFTIGSAGNLLQYRTSAGVGKEIIVEFDALGEPEARIDQIPSQVVERIVVGLIDQSFAAAASKAGVPYDAIDELVDLFSNRVSFHRDFRKGDRFSLIFQQEVLADDTPVSAGPVLAAALQVGGEDLIAIRFVGSDGKTRYFDGKGELLGNSFLRYPLKFSRISSHFSTSRFHPVLKRRRPHNGVDFAAPTGTPVRSVADGVITYAGRKGGGGKTIKIRHSDRYSTAYLHLSRINKGIRKGAKVSRGEVIGAVGMTGLATGPHLHYSFYDRGKYVDPLKIKLPTVERLGKGTKIHSRYLSRVLYTLKHYQNVALDNFYWG